jgi:tRNA pseudouridine38-40 synthase
VQAALQQALSRVADEPIEVTCAGRTDAGVHAREQVVHFDTAAAAQCARLAARRQQPLPRDISLRWVQAGARAFSCALQRAGAQLSLPDPQPRHALGAGGRARAGGVPAARCGGDAGRRPVADWRARLQRLSLLGVPGALAGAPAALAARGRSGERIAIEVTANAFLHHMVRNIVGLLLVIGQQRAAPERARQQLESRERSSGEATAAAHGLYLWRVDYAAQFGLPADSAMIDASIHGWP